ncbi:hypothetical protein [Catellatospora sp. TT07R-123]|uniref:hypothetical protein n=1 Tax=Catellatospora sp. TT07R-123 TaxID=2733863 RepID=UPI001BB340B6|nr:hypothetical protein [Catellatospora sp. TT07R-123]
MIERPSQRWRQEVLEQQQALAAGTLAPDDAYAERLWPLSFSDAVDAALAVYDADLARLADPSDDEVLATAATLVRRLNGIDDEHGRIETDEREELCEYIEAAAIAAGVDVQGLYERTDDREALTAGRDW